MVLLSLWIIGGTRTGKTTRLINQFQRWVRDKLSHADHQFLSSAILILTVNQENRRQLSERLILSVSGSYPVICKTPLGFITDEVMLFWPILFEKLQLKAQFPLKLRPETEQELATRLWRSHLNYHGSSQVNEYRFVRRTLDLLQLAGASGTPPEDIPNILEQGLSESILYSQWLALISQEEITQLNHQVTKIGDLLLNWRRWCLERGLLSYGLIYELYWRYLLPNPTYRQHLARRYEAILADDVDDYPAIVKDLADFLLDEGIFGVFTYNPEGQVRLGLNADPEAIAQLSSRCEIVTLPQQKGIGTELADEIMRVVQKADYGTYLPSSVQLIVGTSRAEMLRKTSELIVQAVKKEMIKPAEIAIIAPGLDEIARYTLMEILSAGGVPVSPLNEQRPLISSPWVRALLTLLGLVYQGLGHLVLRDEIAEMLVILSHKPDIATRKLMAAIDPVRAGLIADHCYHPDPQKPLLLPIESFSRWDRLGYRTTAAYQIIRTWIEETQTLLKKPSFSSPLLVLDKAIKDFIGTDSWLPYDQLSSLKELMETAHHYWEVDRRLRQNNPSLQSSTEILSQFIQLLRRGTITANPRPVNYLGQKTGSVILATIFQYRSLRSFHPWQFWLDVSSPLWEQGGSSSLIASPLFLRNWPRDRELTAEYEQMMNTARLHRILKDLLGRVGEKVFFCHSDLAVNGSEQLGPLFPLVQRVQEHQ